VVFNRSDQSSKIVALKSVVLEDVLDQVEHVVVVASFDEVEPFVY
jgi:hypothetical protein